MNRRSFLRSVGAGLLVPLAPAIVRADSLMPLARVHDPVMPGQWLKLTDRCESNGTITRELRDRHGRLVSSLGVGMLPLNALNPGTACSLWVRPMRDCCELDVVWS